MARISNKKLALIHIIKKEVGLSDREYRNILERVAGVRSASELTEQQFSALMRYFVRSKYYRVNRFGMTFRQKMYIDSLIRRLGWDRDHLHNFIRKYYHKESPAELSKSDASRLIESLKQILAHRKPASGE
ncbi:MAG: DUF1018 domain-containing protein [Candidatus Omnitrophica bacterium]|nr:DUF1018 domain-containing protein [Candidatus Omnitrophota bacterium]